MILQKGAATQHPWPAHSDSGVFLVQVFRRGKGFRIPALRKRRAISSTSRLFRTPGRLIHSRVRTRRLNTQALSPWPGKSVAEEFTGFPKRPSAEARGRRRPVFRVQCGFGRAVDAGDDQAYRERRIKQRNCGRDEIDPRPRQEGRITDGNRVVRKTSIRDCSGSAQFFICSTKMEKRRG